MQTLLSKQTKKSERIYRVLLGLVDLYLKIGTPIGSNTLKGNGFQDLSSATIRNYFSALEKLGYLHQQHSSGGRAPTDKAFRAYVDHHQKDPIIDEEEFNNTFDYLEQLETRELAGELCKAAERFSEFTGLAICLTAPRFDQDFIRDMKLTHLDTNRYLCILVTDFGLVQTEILYSSVSLSSFALKRIEQFFHAKLTGQSPLTPLSRQEEEIALTFYQEALVRYLIHYSHFNHDDLYLTGFSKLLPLPEFQDPKALAQGLALFEDHDSLRKISRECIEKDALTYFIGSDLKEFHPLSTECSVLTVPYHIHANSVGSIALLGPMRMDYREKIGALHHFSKLLSSFLTRNIYTFKLQYRQPHSHTAYLEHPNKLLSHHSPLKE